MVTPSLRGVALELAYPEVQCRFIYDHAPCACEYDIVSDIETEMIADLSPTCEVQFRLVGIVPPAPRDLVLGEEWVFLRREERGDVSWAQVISEQVSAGPAFQEKVVEGAEFVGVNERAEFASVIREVVMNGETRTLQRGRTAFWWNGTVVIRDPHAEGGGTAFRPRSGYDYFLNTLH
jgi:hypothetical protein